MGTNLQPVSYPPILPTGAMSSGNYTSYMITYDTLLADYVLQQLNNNYAQGTINDWSDLWNRIMRDVNCQVTDLTDRLNKVQAKITMIQNIIKTL